MVCYEGDGPDLGKFSKFVIAKGGVQQFRWDGLCVRGGRRKKMGLDGHKLGDLAKMAKR